MKVHVTEKYIHVCEHFGNVLHVQYVHVCVYVRKRNNDTQIHPQHMIVVSATCNKSIATMIVKTCAEYTLK